MEKHRYPEHGPGPWSNRRRPSWSNDCCMDGGYIVEKIIGQHKQEACFEGCITLSGLPAHLCPPLTLCGVEVVQVQPRGINHACSACNCAPAKDFRQPLDTPSAIHDVLLVTLLCQVVDSCGCRSEGIACIDIELCRPNGHEICGVNMRRGAQVFVRNACFCAPCSFQVCMDICVQTVMSRCEVLGNKPFCAPVCPPLPLYPPPIKRPCCRPYC